MNKRIILLLAFLFNVHFLIAQNMNSIWIFGDSAGIDFRIPNNPVPITSGMDGRGSCVSISDSLGNLQLYAATLAYLNSDWATRAFNSTDQIVLGCDSITGEGWYNELIAIPRANHPNQYYVYGAGLDSPNNQGCYYTLIDLSLNGGLGQVVQQNIQINNQTHGDCLSAVKHGNGRDWWLLGKYSDRNPPNHYNRFFVYLITPDSIYAPIVQDFNDAMDVDFQRIIFNSVGTRFMLINQRGYMAEFSFDRCSGTVSTYQIIFQEQTSNFDRLFWEGAYSPNDSVFYVSTSGLSILDTFNLLQYNLVAPNIPASCDTLDSFCINTSFISTGALRLAPDGKIYFTRAYENPAAWSYPYADSMRNYINENLSVINSPNNLGSACDYQPFSFYLGGKRTYYGLPNNPNYSLGSLAGSQCDTLYLATNEIEKQKALDIFPNPFSNKISLKFGKRKTEKVLMRILDSLGNIIVSKNILSVNQEFDLSFLQTGVFILQVQTDEGIFSKRIVKMR